MTNDCSPCPVVDCRRSSLLSPWSPLISDAGGTRRHCLRSEAGGTAAGGSRRHCLRGCPPHAWTRALTILKGQISLWRLAINDQSVTSDDWRSVTMDDLTLSFRRWSTISSNETHSALGCVNVVLLSCYSIKLTLDRFGL